MALSKRYQASNIEPLLRDTWEKEAVYIYPPEAQGPVFSIDTPPPTVTRTATRISWPAFGVCVVTGSFIQWVLTIMDCRLSAW
jgi:hypothetical protein